MLKGASRNPICGPLFQPGALVLGQGAMEKPNEPVPHCELSAAHAEYETLIPLVRSDARSRIIDRRSSENLARPRLTAAPCALTADMVDAGPTTDENATVTFRGDALNTALCTGTELTNVAVRTSVIAGVSVDVPVENV